MGGEYQIDKIMYAKLEYSKCIHVRTRGREDKKSVVRCARTVAPW